MVNSDPGIGLHERAGSGGTMHSKIGPEISDIEHRTYYHDGKRPTRFQLIYEYSIEVFVRYMSNKLKIDLGNDKPVHSILRKGIVILISCLP
jgi:hypothetical protein